MKISTKNIFIINNSGSKDPWSKNTHKNENAAYSEKKLAFKGIYYSYWIPPLYQKKLSFQTNMMRDIVVKYVPEYIQKRFPKEKINKFELFCGASSFGHEPVSVQMLLAENKQISNLAYPMKAVELNPVASDIASKGILEITDGDFQKILQVIKNPSKYINLCKESNPEVIDEYKKLLGNAKITKVSVVGGKRSFLPVDESRIKDDNIYKVSPEIMQNIDFICKDFNDVDFNIPSLVMFRNSLMHFSSADKKKFLTNLYEKLPENSSLMLAGGDLTRNVGQFALEAGFKPANGELKSIKDWQKFKNNPLTFIFEKG